MNDELIGEILPLYRLEGAEVILLRHNENRTYRVNYGGRSYCLRIKQPMPGFDLSVLPGDKNLSPEALLAGETALIKAVGEKTDIPVQTPVKSLSGDELVKLPGGLMASLLTWLEGEPLSELKSELASDEKLLIVTGRTFAELRCAAEDTEFPKLTRFSYDQSLIQRLITLAEAGGEYLPAEIINSAVRALTAVSNVMDELDGSEHVAIAHADSGPGNLIRTSARVGLIDWSLSGYAHSYMDLGGLMALTNERECQKLLLKGWEEVRGKTERRYIDAYFALNVLLFICCQYTRSKEWADWYPTALNRWRETIFDPFSSGCLIPAIL